MPPLPPVPQVLKIQILGTNEGQNWANVFHAKYTGGPPTAAECAALADDFLGNYASNVMPHVGEAWVLQECKVTDLTSDTSNAGEATGSTAGSLIGPTWSAQVACCVSWPIARRYRGGHPRTYFPPGLETDSLDTSHWKPAYLANIQAAALAFQVGVDVTAEGSVTACKLGCVSYVLAGAPRDVPLFFPFTGGPAVHSRIDTQRRRLGRETS